MWNPDFKFTEKLTGQVSGYHRRLCLKSTVYRGTPDCHGLVFGLDQGDSCQGMAFRIATEDLETELQTVWEREMFVGNLYSHLGKCTDKRTECVRDNFCYQSGTRTLCA